MSRSVILAGIAVLAVGVYLRTVRLGDGYLNIDDLNHHFAAQSLRDGRGPLLPSGSAYERGIDFTRLVMLAQPLADDLELADRIPAAALGIVNLLLFGLIVWRLAGPWAAVASVGFLAIYPEAVHQSRQVRFYTLQLCFGLGALYAGWKVLEDAGRAAADRAPILRRWAWAGAALICFGLAARVQITTGSVALGWGFAVLLAAAADLRALGPRGWRMSVPMQLALGGLAMLVLAAVVTPGLFADLWARGRYMPEAYGSRELPPLYYYHQLFAQFPGALALTPLAILVSWSRAPRLTVYLLAWFVVPVALHSLVFVWKAERFIFLAVPALLAVWGIAVAQAGGWVIRLVEERLAPRGATPAVRTVVGAVVVVGVMFAYTRTPAFWNARMLTGQEPAYKRDQWTTAAHEIERIRNGSKLPVGSSIPLASLLYDVPVDFGIHRQGIERSNPAGREWLPQGTRDYYAGVPTLTTPEAIRARYPDADTALIVVDSTRWPLWRIVDSTLHRTLRTEAVDACAGRCGRLLLFVWPLDRVATMAAQPDVPEAAQ